MSKVRRGRKRVYFGKRTGMFLRIPKALLKELKEYCARRETTVTDLLVKKIKETIGERRAARAEERYAASEAGRPLPRTRPKTSNSEKHATSSRAPPKAKMVPS